MSQAGIVSVSAAAGIVDSVTGINGVVASPTTGNVVVQLANRVEGTAITTDAATPMTLLTVPLGGIAGTYLFTTQIVVFDVTDSLGAGYVSYNNVRTTGIAAIIPQIGSSLVFEGEEGTLSGITVVETINSVANTFSIVVNGLASTTIHYRAVTTYIFVS